MPDSYNVRVETDLSGLRAMAALVPERTKAAVDRAVAAGERVAKQACPVDTGNLRGSIVGRNTGTARRPQGVIETGVEYAPHVEFGAQGRPGEFFMEEGADAARDVLDEALDDYKRGG